LGVVLEARPGGVHKGRAGVGDCVGVALVGGEEDGAIGSDGWGVADGSVNFDFPFELAVRSEGGEKRCVRAVAGLSAIHSEINCAIGGEGWTGVAIGLDIPFALTIGQDGFDEIGIAKIDDAGVVDDRRAEQAVGEANGPMLLAFGADGEEDGRAVAFDVDHAICANGGKTQRAARQLDEPKNVAVRIETIEPLLMSEIDCVV